MNFRLAYRWMADKLRVVAPEISDDPPIWCWHSCSGVRKQMPSVGVACSLLSEYDIQQGMVVIELLVPSAVTICSSYYAWNRFLDCVIVKQRLPKSHLRSRWMFEEPLFRHVSDDIQTVIPEINPHWIRRVDELVVNDVIEMNQSLHTIDPGWSRTIVASMWGWCRTVGPRDRND